LLLTSHIPNKLIVRVLINDAHQITLLWNRGGISCERMLLLNLHLGDGPVDVSMVVHTKNIDVSFLDVEHVCFELILRDLLVL
jgi:hypothetical protein